MAAKAQPVAIIMGSQSDWQTMKAAAETLDALDRLGVPDTLADAEGVLFKGVPCVDYRRASVLQFASASPTAPGATPDAMSAATRSRALSAESQPAMCAPRRTRSISAPTYP